MSDDNMATLLEQRSELVDKLCNLACYPEYHEGLNDAIRAIDSLIAAFSKDGGIE